MKPDIDFHFHAAFYRVIGLGLTGALFPGHGIEWRGSVPSPVQKNPAAERMTFQSAPNGLSIRIGSFYPETYPGKVGFLWRRILAPVGNCG